MLVTTATSRAELEERAVGLVGLDHRPLPRAPGRVRAAPSAARRRSGRPGRGRRRAARARPSTRWWSCRGCRSTAIVRFSRDSSPSRSPRCSDARRPPRAPRPARGCPPGSPSTRPPRRPRAGSPRRGRRLARSRRRAGAERRRLGAVGARHVGAQRLRHQRQPAHPGAADPDEMQGAAGEGRFVHRGRTLLSPPARSARPRSAPPRRAWPPRAPPSPSRPGVAARQQRPHLAGQPRPVELVVRHHHRRAGLLDVRAR